MKIKRESDEKVLAITIPAWNEENTIQQVIKSIPSRIAGIKSIFVIVIDDGSTDLTAARARECSSENNNVMVISNLINKGLAYSFRRGLETALQLGADIIVNTDGDNQYDQAQIPQLIQPILDRRADMVLGSRFRGNIEHMSVGKYWGNRLATAAVNIVSGLNVSDGQTGFRAFTHDAAMRLNVLSNFTYTQETILEAADKQLKLVEIPCTFRKRADKNRLFGNIFDYMFRASSTLLVGLLKYRPLRTFMTIGVVIVLIGLVSGFRVIIQFIQTGAVEPYLPSAIFTAMCIILGIQFSALGLIASMLKHQRQLQEMIWLDIKRANFSSAARELQKNKPNQLLNSQNRFL